MTNIDGQQFKTKDDNKTVYTVRDSGDPEKIIVLWIDEDGKPDCVSYRHKAFDKHTKEGDWILIN